MSKINVHLPRHFGFKDKNALLDQNFGFAWSSLPSNIDSKPKHFGQADSDVGICKKAQEVQIALCPSEKHITNFISDLIYSENQNKPDSSLHLK